MRTSCLGDWLCKKRLDEDLLATRSLRELDSSAVAMSYGGTGTDFWLLDLRSQKTVIP